MNSLLLALPAPHTYSNNIHEYSNGLKDELHMNRFNPGIKSIVNQSKGLAQQDFLHLWQMPDFCQFFQTLNILWPKFLQGYSWYHLNFLLQVAGHFIHWLDYAIEAWAYKRKYTSLVHLVSVSFFYQQLSFKSSAVKLRMCSCIITTHVTLNNTSAVAKKWTDVDSFYSKSLTQQNLQAAPTPKNLSTYNLTSLLAVEGFDTKYTAKYLESENSKETNCSAAQPRELCDVIIVLWTC